MKRFILGFVVLQCLQSAMVSEAAWAEPVVIVHKDNPVGQVSASDLKKIFVADKQSWAAGKIQVCILDGDLADEFNQSILKIPTKKFAKIWFKKVFQGEALPANKFATEAELLAFVKDNKGAVGYLDSATVSDAVKVLKVE